MRMERPNAEPLLPEEVAQLDKLKGVVEKALQDGKFSTDELDRIQSIIWADRKVTYEELRTLHETIQSVMGNLEPELEWIPHGFPG